MFSRGKDPLVIPCRKSRGMNLAEGIDREKTVYLFDGEEGMKKKTIHKILIILVTILLPASVFGSPLTKYLINQPIPGQYEKIVIVTDFYRTFHIYPSLIDVRIEDGSTFIVELWEPDKLELTQMKNFLGHDFSNLKKYGFTKLSIQIGETKYIWEVK